jgi:CHASE2 domain-containing sensor protein
VRTTVLIVSGLLMLIGALGDTLVVLPDLHGDLIEIGVRPTVLGGTVLHLYFSAAAMFAFAVIVAVAAVDSVRGRHPARVPLAAIALIYGGYGVVAFSHSHNPHHFVPVVIGLLLAAATAIPRAR